MKPSTELKIVRWAAKAQELRQVKADELELRLELVKEVFPADSKGTVSAKLSTGHELVAVFETRHGLAAEDKTRPVLEKMAKADPAGPELVKRLVKWTPEIRVGELKKLPAKLRKMIDAVLSSSPATPTLELRSPK